MRLADFLGSHLAGVSRVIEVHSGTTNLEPYLALPAAVAYERSRDRAPHEGRLAEILLLTVLGPDEERFGREDDALATLAGLGAGQRCAVVIGYPTPALPVHRLLDALSESGSQLVQLASLEHQGLHAAAMAVQLGDDVALPRDPFGRPIAPEAAGTERELTRRLMNEFVLLDFVARNLRAQVFRLGGSSVEGPDAVARRDELERWTEQAKAQAEQARVDADVAKADAQRARAETEAARAEADVLRREVDRLQSEIARMEASTSLRLGRSLVDTARHPASAPRLPIELVRLWRHRGRAVAPSPGPGGARRRGLVARTPSPAPKPTTVPSAPTIATANTVEDHQRRFVAHLAFEARPRTTPVIAGILTDSTAGALEFDATLNRITPNDGRVIIERTEPDLLLIETAALGAGRPWAYVGDSSATDRTARLIELIDQVHALGKAAVLVRDAFQPAAGLIPLESRFDLVVDAGPTTRTNRSWSRGVQLARFHLVGDPATRDRVPLFVGGVPSRAPLSMRRSTHEAILAFDALGLEVLGDPDDPVEGLDPVGNGATPSSWLTWMDAPAVYRARVTGVANPFSVPDAISAVTARILEQLACGMDVLSGPNLALTAGFGPWVRTFPTAAQAAAAARESVDGQGRSASDTRSLLRTLFESHATPVMLAALTRHIGSSPDPLARRSVAAVVVGTAMDRPRVVDSLISQKHRPREVLLDTEHPWSATERDALEAAGIRTRLLDTNGGETGWSTIGSLADSEWLARWATDRPVGPWYLLDLAAGAETSRADVVGYGDDPPPTGDGVTPASAIVRRSVAVTSLVGHPLSGDMPFARASGKQFRPVSIGPEDSGR